MYGKLSHDVIYFNDLHNYSKSQKKIYGSYFDRQKFVIETYFFLYAFNVLIIFEKYGNFNLELQVKFIYCEKATKN